MTQEPSTSRTQPSRGRASPRARTAVVRTILAWAVLAAPLQAQNGSEEEEAAVEAARIAKADSVRAGLVQPPSGPGGLVAMDAVRIPFQLIGGTLSLALATGMLVHDLLDEMGLVPDVRDDSSDEPDGGLDVGVDFIGSRSWPALVATVRTFDPLHVEAGYSLRRYELYGAGLDFGDGGRGVRIAGRHRVLRELHFWGIGPGTEPTDRTDFKLRRTEGGAHAWNDFGGPVRLGVGGAWERSEVGRGSDGARPDLQDVFDPGELFGAMGEPTFLRFDAEVDADFTTIRSLQPRGVRIIGGYQVFKGLDDTDADFHRATADARAMAPLGPRHVLALRLLVTDHFRERGQGVPFTHLAELGDDDGLRGYGSRRFRDRALLAGQAELRYEVWWHPGNPRLRVEGLVFADYGAVGPELSAIESSDFALTPGLGIRFTRDGVGLVEAFAAWGGETSPRFDAALGVSF